MPNAPETFRPAWAKAPKEAKQRRGSARSKGYNAAWERFRKWYFSFSGNVLCGCGCRQPAEQLDHIDRVEGPHDPRFLDQGEVIGLAHGCHSRKTALLDGAFGNAPTIKGQEMRDALRAEAQRRAEIMEASEGMYG